MSEENTGRAGAILKSLHAQQASLDPRYALVIYADHTGRVEISQSVRDLAMARCVGSPTAPIKYVTGGFLIIRINSRELQDFLGGGSLIQNILKGVI